MNELVPINKNHISLPLDELGIARLSLANNKIFIFIIPIFLFFFFKNKNRLPKLSLDDYEQPKKSPIDSNSLDKMSYLLESIKKATTLNDLRRNMTQSTNSFGKQNIRFVKELLNVFSDGLDENNKAHIKNISSVMSLLEKGTDIKKVIDIKKALKSGDGDLSAKINNIIDTVAPMLPPKYAKKTDEFKKMAKMMQLMSLFDGDDNEDETSVENDYDTIIDKNNSNILPTET